MTLIAVLTDRPRDWTSDDWNTPADFVTKLEREFGRFDLDPCARSWNAKAPRYFTKEQNGLRQEWTGRVFCNPPYSKPAPWIRKSHDAVTYGSATLVVMLLPASTDTAWFHDLVLPYAEVRWIRGRIRFLGWRGTPIGSPKAGNLLALFRRATV